MAGKKTQKKIDEAVEDAGRKPTLPSLLLGKHHKVIGVNGGNGHREPDEFDVPRGAPAQGSMQLEDYNALERLLEAGTPQDLDTRTELNELQILHFARAEIMAEYYGSDRLRDFVASIKRKQISKDRKGRREFTEAMRGAGMNDPAGGTFNSIQDRLRS